MRALGCPKASGLLAWLPSPRNPAKRVKALLGLPVLPGPSHLNSRRVARGRAVIALLALILHVGCHGASAPPTPIAILKFAKPLSADPSNADVTLAFLADDAIAVRFCTGPVRAPTCRLRVVKLSGGELRIAVETEDTQRPTHTDGIFAMSKRAILLAYPGVQYLYSWDLKTRREIPIHDLVVPSTGSNVIGGSDASTDQWAVYRLSPEFVAIRKGRGPLYQATDDYVVLYAGGAVRIETLTGRLLGLFPVEHSPPLTGRLPSPFRVEHGQLPEPFRPRIIEPGRLYLDGRQPRIIDFSGRELLRLRVPPDSSPRHGWSVGGRRMLYDYCIRTPTSLRELVETYLPIPKNANREIIRVVDTMDGGICFQWDSPLHGFEYGYHADLSPSGRLLAVVTGTELSVYPLPEVCASR